MFPGFDTPASDKADARSLCVGGYRLGEMIGLGGTGAIYAAWPVESPGAVPVALKLLRADHANEPDAIEGLRHEASLLGALAHPSIVRALDAGTADTQPFLVLELLSGGSLQRLMRAGGPLPAWRVADLLDGVANALVWLHRRGIVHGDVKPMNLLRNGSGQVKLIDFGTARAARDPDWHRPPHVATPAYAAPERLLGLAPDPRDDVFSLAVVAYQLLAGRHPFGSDPVLAIGRPARPGGIDDEAWRRLLAALAPARTDRPDDPSALIAAIGACHAASGALCRD